MPVKSVKKARELNDVVRYTMWSVFRLRDLLGNDGDGPDRAALTAEVEELFGKLAANDTVIRGVYDVSGLRADADLLIWWHAESSDDLQAGYQEFRSTAVRPAAV